MADFLPHLRLRPLIDSSMEELPAELTIDILSRLPVKTIIHCKLVCKKWWDLVSDSYFVNLHISRSPTGLIVHDKASIPWVYNSYLPNIPGILKWVEIEDKVDHHHLHYHRLFRVDLNPPSVNSILPKSQIRHVGSVNGLICLWQHLPFDITYICNPVTREYLTLSKQRIKRYGFGEVVYGFGVCSLTGEYKVVRTFQAKVGDKPSRPSVLEAEVYTLGTRQWRSLGPVPAPYWLNGVDNFYGPFLNNHCHWIVCNVEDTHETIATFDLDKETFQLFPSPPLEENRCHHQSLGVLKGCLCKLNTYDSELIIWVMKEYGIKNSWHKEVVIRLEIRDEYWVKTTYLIAGLKDGSILMVFKNALCVFDPRSETIKDTNMFYNLSGLAYRPSFLKLQHFESERVDRFFGS